MSAGGWRGQGRWGDCNEYTVSSEVMKMSNENTAAQSQNTLKALKRTKDVLKGAPHAMSAHPAAGTLALASRPT